MIAAQYVGDPYPAIGYFASDEMLLWHREELPDPFDLMNDMDAWIQQICINSLMQEAEYEPLTWAEVLARSAD